MIENGKPQLIKPLPDICPYLALKEDPKTFSSYPSKWNACFHSKPVSSPTIRHQREFCLDENHVNCFLYKTSEEIKMPKEMGTKSKGLFFEAKRKQRIYVWGVVILLVGLGIILGGRLVITHLLGDPDISEPTEGISAIITDDASQIVETVDVTPSPLSNGIPKYTPTPTISLPTPTSTLTSTTPPLALETPIGLEYQIVIHRAVEGESLLLFANWYSTNPEAIQAINLDLSYPIKVGDLVIIPIGITDVSSLPKFKPYEVLDEGISVRELAEQIDVSVVDLCFYNNIDENQTLHKGDWIIVPQPTNSP